MSLQSLKPNTNDFLGVQKKSPVRPNADWVWLKSILQKSLTFDDIHYLPVQLKTVLQDILEKMESPIFFQVPP